MKTTPSISELIFERLSKTPKQFVFGGELERTCGTFHKPSTISRVLRDLALEGEIEKAYEKVSKNIRSVVKYKFKKLKKKNV